jgi:molecular chaperone GrpE (heat shock protein)
MADDPNLVWFGGVLTVICTGLVLSFVGKPAKPTPPRLPAPSNLDLDPIALQQQCLRLRTELLQQKAQLTADIQAATFEQLQTLLTNYPTARQMAVAKPDLPARNLSALFTPLENLLETWQITPIGPAWAQVPYDPHCHQPDEADMTPTEPVYIRFVGYQQGDRILCPAKVSRTLPQ